MKVATLVPFRRRHPVRQARGFDAVIVLMLLSALLSPFENRKSRLENSITYDAKGQLASAKSNGQLLFAYAWDTVGRTQSNPASNDFYPGERSNPYAIDLAGEINIFPPGSASNVSIQRKGGGDILMPSLYAIAGKPGVNGFTQTYTGLTGYQEFLVTGRITGKGIATTVNGVTTTSDAVAEMTKSVTAPASQTQSLTYDKNGNRISDSRWTYTWNGGNQLTRAVETTPLNPASPQQIDYKRDWAGRLAEETTTVNGNIVARTVTLYDGWLPVREIDFDGLAQETARRTYTWGPDFTGRLHKKGAGIGGLIEVLEKKGAVTTRSLPFYDCNQNLVGAVDAITGEVVASFSYGPFGELLSATGSRADSIKYRFQTRRYDERTGLYQWPLRLYDPKARTWLSRDPIREAGGINSYQYNLNNPLGTHDPLGLDLVGAFTFEDPQQMDLYGPAAGFSLDDDYTTGFSNPGASIAEAAFQVSGAGWAYSHVAPTGFGYAASLARQPVYWTGGDTYRATHEVAPDDVGIDLILNVASFANPEAYIAGGAVKFIGAGFTALTFRRAIAAEDQLSRAVSSVADDLVLEALAKSKTSSFVTVKTQPSIPGIKFDGTIYRAPYPGTSHSIIDSYNIAASHRYSQIGEGALYFSTGRKIVTAELGGNIGQRSVFSFETQLDNLLDLSNPSVRSQLGVSLDDLIRRGGVDAWRYELTQPLGSWSRSQGYNGIIAPSAQIAATKAR